MDVVLYSTNCPRCMILEKKLNSANVNYKTVTDVDLMVEKGFTSIPVLEVDNEIMDFKSAIDWVNNKTGDK